MDSKTNKNKPSSKTDFLFRFILIAFLLFAFFVLNNIQNDNNNFYVLIKWFFLYLTLITFLSYFNRYKIINVLHSILSLPAAILLAFRPLIYSLVPIYFAYVMTMALTFIFIVALPTKIAEITIKKPAITFILLTVTSIIMTTFGDKIVRKWHDFHDKEDKEIHYELSLKILDQKKSRYLIFVVYFILLLIFNIASLNDKPMFDDDRITTAILQSFATFIAYDRLLTNWSSIKSKS